MLVLNTALNSRNLQFSTIKSTFIGIITTLSIQNILLKILRLIFCFKKLIIRYII